MYLKIYCSERPLLEVWLFLMDDIVSFIRIYSKVRGKYFSNVLINIYFIKVLNQNKNIQLDILTHRRM